MTEATLKVKKIHHVGISLASSTNTICTLDVTHGSFHFIPRKTRNENALISFRIFGLVSNFLGYKKIIVCFTTYLFLSSHSHIHMYVADGTVYFSFKGNITRSLSCDMRHGFPENPHRATFLKIVASSPRCKNCSLPIQFLLVFASVYLYTNVMTEIRKGQRTGKVRPLCLILTSFLIPPRLYLV